MNRVLLTLTALACITLAASGASKKNVKKQSTNPFLTAYTTRYEIPPFEKIRYEHYLPALQAGIDQQNAQIAAIVNNQEQPTFENTVLALDNCGEILNKVQYVFFALVESDNTDEMHALAEKLMPMITAQDNEVNMNSALFERIKAVHDKADQLGLDRLQRRLTDKYYKRFVRNGALLTPALQDTLKAINLRQAALSLSFTNNVMNEIANNVIWVDNAARLSGLSQSTIDDAARLAADKGQPGKWAFTATGATRLAVLGSADDRQLRRDMYETYTNTASRGNDCDNSKNINELIQLRQRKAQLLGYETFADYAVAPVMAGTVERAEALLMQLWEPAIAKVAEEVADMQAYADAHGAHFKIAPYDYYYYAEKVKAQKFNFSEEEVRPYFELNNVVKNGIFYAANRLYGLTFTEMKDAPKYNPEVTVYDVRDEQGKHVAGDVHVHIDFVIVAQRIHIGEAAQAGGHCLDRQGEACQRQPQHAVEGPDAEGETAHGHAAYYQHRHALRGKHQQETGQQHSAKAPGQREVHPFVEYYHLRPGYQGEEQGV